MRIEAIVALSIPLTYALLRVIETLRPGLPQANDRRWQFGGMLYFALIGAINQTVGTAAKVLLPLSSLLDGDALGVVAGGVVGFLMVSLGNALLHRAYHRWAFLWRHVHRFHHIPGRLDVAGVMYQTPFEMLANALLFTFVVVYVLGLAPLPMMLCAYIAAFYGMFQHMNTPTPRWLGLFIQRPEAHSLHHRKYDHEANYSDFPLWDMLTGDFRNPAEFEPELGIAQGSIDDEGARRNG